jgi:chromosome segregation ATPase
LTECTNPIHTDGLPRLVELRQRVQELEQKYKDVCSGWDTQYVTRLEQQVADLTAKLAQAQMELRERAKDCAEHCEDFTRAQLQLNTVKRQLAQKEAL